ncbi:hypothetical protein G3A_07435 [Bacillus sp. 17376]|uniref:Uncharacterized protein n=1 Tax=Mesobacillus boroniphilus JCM 21738 TaxID=1294265 RepID=W4RLL9_9BACI|nr:hypothetical protein [Mesobacillus boroniphilus]ESU33196.1 hypothetical protein G3A_07435 [Bacillus sp. 17376]GAE44454.1 hypothetical protein JCM21738_1167 [Mesobacillus boroniphilus JCM 21738]
MVRIHNPVKGDKNKVGADGQLHGGVMETADEFFDSIFQQGTKNKVGDKAKKQK